MAEDPKIRLERGARRLVPRKEAMHRLAIGRQKWHQLAKENRLPISRIDSRVYIRSDLLDDLVDHPEKLGTPGGRSDV